MQQSTHAHKLIALGAAAYLAATPAQAQDAEQAQGIAKEAASDEFSGLLSSNPQYARFRMVGGSDNEQNKFVKGEALLRYAGHPFSESDSMLEGMFADIKLRGSHGAFGIGDDGERQDTSVGVQAAAGPNLKYDGNPDRIRNVFSPRLRLGYLQAWKDAGTIKSTGNAEVGADLVVKESRFQAQAGYLHFPNGNIKGRKGVDGELSGNALWAMASYDFIDRTTGYVAFDWLGTDAELAVDANGQHIEVGSKTTRLRGQAGVFRAFTEDVFGGVGMRATDTFRDNRSNTRDQPNDHNFNLEAEVSAGLRVFDFTTLMGRTRIGTDGNWEVGIDVILKKQ